MTYIYTRNTRETKQTDIHTHEKHTRQKQNIYNSISNIIIIPLPISNIHTICNKTKQKHIIIQTTFSTHKKHANSRKMNMRTNKPNIHTQNQTKQQTQKQKLKHNKHTHTHTHIITLKQKKRKNAQTTNMRQKQKKK